MSEQKEQKNKKYYNPASRRWMCTIWEKEDELEKGKELAHIANIKDLKYACVGYETGETGKPHYHVYLHLANPQRLSRVKKLINDSRAHCEPCREELSVNVEYIMHTGLHADKEGELLNSWEYGDKSSCGQGSRTDVANEVEEMAALMDDIENGLQLRELRRKYPSIILRYLRNVQSLIEMVKKEKREEDVARTIALKTPKAVTKKTPRKKKAVPNLNADSLEVVKEKAA